MRESIQDILNNLYQTMAQESETAAAKVRETFQSLAKLIEKPRDEIATLKARVDALEAEVADLKSKLPRA